MSFVSISSSSLITSYHPNRHKIFNLNPTQSSSLTPLFSFIRRNNPFCITENVQTISRMKTLGKLSSGAIACTKRVYHPGEEDSVLLDYEDEEVQDSGSPWEGAIIFKRSSTISHFEYCTTLERLGLGKVSTEVSKSRASEMGLRVTRDVKDYPFGTPVQVSVDVTKMKKKLRLDGIVKTVIALGCNRCGEPTGESIFLNFALLLTAEPIEEPDVIEIGAAFGKDKNKPFAGIGEGVGEEEDEASIDFDDRLHFPMGEKEIDISKHIRDLVHLEININAICGPQCKGMCLKCGFNLNTGVCECSKRVEIKSSGPLGNLKQKLQAKS